MRVIKRQLRRLRRHIQDKKRLREIAPEIQSLLKLPSEPSFKLMGASGHDGNYQVISQNSPIGMLRLVGEHGKQVPPPPHMPFILLDDTARLRREWDCYTAAGALAPTPLHLWPDALLCQYLPLQSLHEALTQKPDNAWSILSRATHAIQQLHQKGITHMDISLKNMLHDPQNDHVYFIDFEYSPAKGLSIETQRIYDHLRLIESTWKFIPESMRAATDGWLKVFAEVAADDLKKADIARLKPALNRILSDKTFSERLKKLG